MSTKLLVAMGVESEELGLRAVEASNLFLGECQAAAGTKDFAGIVASLKDGRELARIVAEVTGKSGPEAIGALHALKASADAYVEAKARLDAVEAESAKAEAERAKVAAIASIDAAVTGGRLVPAHREKAVALHEAHGPVVLAAFLDALPVVVSAPPAQPPTPVASAAEDDTAERARVAAQLGISTDKANEYAARLAAAQE